MAEPVTEREAWDPACQGIAGASPSQPASTVRAAGSSGNKRGLECRWCKCKHLRVIYTKATWGGRIMRRMECWHCGKRMTTWERPISAT
jgi:hypothetical protein